MTIVTIRIQINICIVVPVFLNKTFIKSKQKQQDKVFRGGSRVWKFHSLLLS